MGVNETRFICRTHLGNILKPGDTLGDGRLLEIGSDSVVFLVAPKTGAPSNRVVLRLATN